MRRPPKQVPKIGSIEALDRHFDTIAEETRRRARLRLNAEFASAERREAEMAKLETWLTQWRTRAPAAIGSLGK